LPSADDGSVSGRGVFFPEAIEILNIEGRVEFGVGGIGDHLNDSRIERPDSIGRIGSLNPDVVGSSRSEGEDFDGFISVVDMILGGDLGCGVLNIDIIEIVAEAGRIVPRRANGLNVGFAIIVEIDGGRGTCDDSGCCGLRC